MTNKSRRELDRAAAKRQAKAQRENRAAETDQTPAEADEATRPATEAEIAAELAEQEKEAAIAAAKQTLRDYGLYYTITSDRTADRAACLCGCGQFPAGKKSKFCPGHDAKFHSALAGPKAEKHCQCGCGLVVKGDWAPGHNAKHAKRMKELAAQQQVA